MRLIQEHTDKFIIALVLLLITGIVSTYLNLGAISVAASVVLPLLFVLNLLVAIYAIFKRRYIYCIGLIAFLFCFKFFYQISSNETVEDSISLLSYNVRSFDNEDKAVASGILKFIDSINPDILLLQESAYKVGRNIDGFDHHFLGFREGIEKTLLDIYSKYPIVNKGFVDFPESKNNAIYTDLKIENDTIRVYNIHLQSFAFTFGNTDDISGKFSNTLNKQIEQAQIIKEHSENWNGKVIIGGDLNATQFGKPYRIIAESLNDSFIKKGNGLGTTYSLKGYPLRLDYAFTDKTLNINQHKNINLDLSDHQPILIEFKIPKISRS